MKKILFTIAICMLATAAVAQPAKRRAQQASTEKTAAEKKKLGATYREFPVAQQMPHDAEWRRDIYRELDLSKDENAALYYPITPQGNQTNLFTYLFKLILRGQVKAYEYGLDGNENFSPSKQVKAKDIMNKFQINYEENDKGAVRVNDADLPSDVVKFFFIKESIYYDQHTATFNSKVTALCPVLQRGGDFGGSWSRVPMFWVNYEEAAPYLSKHIILTSNLNNAASMSTDDYFMQRMYKGDIYKTVNLQDRILVSDENDTTSLRKERERIEKELSDFEQHVFRGDTVAAKPVVNDSTTEAEATKPKRTARRSTSGRRSSSKSASASKQKSTKQKSSSSKSGSFSVRRQRH